MVSTAAQSWCWSERQNQADQGSQQHKLHQNTFHLLDAEVRHIRSNAFAGEIIKGWRVYPLQLDDLSPISFAATRGSDMAESSNAKAESSEDSALPLDAPAAEEVGPIFYR